MRKKVYVVGGGPAGMMAVTQLLDSDCDLYLMDHKPTIGRKFLVAGEGGFNLTHSEDLPSFLAKYDSDWIRTAVSQFTHTDFRAFLQSIGIETYVGSSGKVFPKEGIKPIQVLNAWKRLLNQRVSYVLNAHLVDFDERNLFFEQDGEVCSEAYDYLVLALGGKSWPVTGSDGSWCELFNKKEIAVSQLIPSNSGVHLAEHLIQSLEGRFIKNCVVSCGAIQSSGDLVVTTFGVQGKPVYAINSALRLARDAVFYIDFKPQLSEEKIAVVLARSKTVTDGLKQLKLGKVAIAWLKLQVDKSTFQNSQLLARLIKFFPCQSLGFRPVEEVISCAGGVALSEISQEGMLHQYPRVFVAGEMIDWDAPTGGYLIQGCVSSGYVVGKAIAKQLVDGSSIVQ